MMIRNLVITTIFIVSFYFVLPVVNAEGSSYPHPDCVAQLDVWNQSVIESQCNKDEAKEFEANGFKNFISRPDTYDNKAYQILDVRGNLYLIERNERILIIRREAGILQFVKYIANQSSCNEMPEDIRKQDGNIVFSQEIGPGDLLGLDGEMNYYVDGNFETGFLCYAKITSKISLEDNEVRLISAEFIQESDDLDTEEEKVFNLCLDEVYRQYVNNGKKNFTPIELQGFYSDVKKQCADGIQLFIEGCDFQGIRDLTGWYAIKSRKNGKEINSELVPVNILQSKTLSIPEEGLYDYCVYTKEYGRRYKEGFTRGENFNIEMFSPLLKGELFKAGELETAQFSQNGFTLNKYEDVDVSVINLTFNGEEYQLIQTAEANKGNYTIKLRYKNKEEVIVNIEGGNIEGSTYAYVIWAGDLDRDGRLDLILNAPDSYAWRFYLRLFLSSKADEGQMLKQVVHKATPGL